MINIFYHAEPIYRLWEAFCTHKMTHLRIRFYWFSALEIDEFTVFALLLWTKNYQKLAVHFNRLMQSFLFQRISISVTYLSFEELLFRTFVFQCFFAVNHLRDDWFVSFEICVLTFIKSKLLKLMLLPNRNWLYLGIYLQRNDLCFLKS